jgi:hypothetical protein
MYEMDEQIAISSKSKVGKHCERRQNLTET